MAVGINNRSSVISLPISEPGVWAGLLLCGPNELMVLGMGFENPRGKWVPICSLGELILVPEVIFRKTNDWFLAK